MLLCKSGPFQLWGDTGSEDQPFVWFYVMCQRCGREVSRRSVNSNLADAIASTSQFAYEDSVRALAHECRAQ